MCILNYESPGEVRWIEARSQVSVNKTTCSMCMCEAEFGVKNNKMHMLLS